MAGLHTTLIFSLVTMYGRTAVGIDRDDAFNTFFGNTGLLRYKGYQSFLASLYCFLMQMTLLIAGRAPPQLRHVSFVAAAYASHVIYKNSQAVIQHAAVLFSPPPKKKKRSIRLSTRQFGVSTRSLLSQSVEEEDDANPKAKDE